MLIEKNRNINFLSLFHFWCSASFLSFTNYATWYLPTDSLVPCLLLIEQNVEIAG